MFRFSRQSANHLKSVWPVSRSLLAANHVTYCRVHHLFRCPCKMYWQVVGSFIIGMCFVYIVTFPYISRLFVIYIISISNRYVIFPGSIFDMWHLCHGDKPWATLTVWLVFSSHTLDGKAGGIGGWVHLWPATCPTGNIMYYCHCCWKEPENNWKISATYFWNFSGIGFCVIL